MDGDQDDSDNSRARNIRTVAEEETESDDSLEILGFDRSLASNYLTIYREEETDSDVSVETVQFDFDRYRILERLNRRFNEGFNNVAAFIGYEENPMREEEPEDAAIDDPDGALILREEELFDSYMQEQNNEDGENIERFDTELPVQHSYLGAMNRVSGIDYFEPGNIYRIPTCTHHSLLFPGETLPMILPSSMFEETNDSNDGLTFGLIFPKIFNTTKPDLYGVTCQIFERGNVDTNGHVTIKARAHQRFKILNPCIENSSQFLYTFGRRMTIDILILPEIILPDPLTGHYFGSTNKFTMNKNAHNKLRLYQASLTAWPKYIFDYYNTEKTLDKIKTYLAERKIESMPNDYIQLSFWLAQNIPLVDNDRHKIFFTNSVNLRLHIIGKSLKYLHFFCCKRCKLKVANCNELFAMSKQGVQTSYCNPAGHIHDTITVYTVIKESVKITDKPSTEFSWFPGYAWQIIVCNCCFAHLGWKFVATKPNLVPRNFYGLSGKSFTVEADSSKKQKIEVEESVDVN